LIQTLRKPGGRPSSGWRPVFSSEQRPAGPQAGGHPGA